LAVASVALWAGSASATWSIIIIDTRTGEIAVASATCLTGFNLRDNTPVLIPLVGAATAQSFVDSSGQNRVKIRDMLIEGAHPDDILAALAVFDSGHQTRQYGIADTLGRAATFSGTGAGGWAGGQIGQVGDLIYAVQGNVLTGEPVVTEAVQAIIDTPGDLAAKLMASMEAARSMGGDGRCSCSGGNPTGCGAPPPTFNKSAHIAYMLIARDGDVAGCNGLSNAGTRPFDVAVGDVNGDGAPDVVSCSGATVSVLINRYQPGDTFVTLAPAVFYPAGADSRGVALGDVTGDGVPDLISAGFVADQLGVHPGNGDGTFGAIVGHAAGDGPRLIATGDFNGDDRLDVACTNQSSNDVSIYLNTGSGLGAQVRRTVSTAPSVIHSGDLDGDDDLDLAILHTGSDRVSFLINNGAGTFALGPVVGLGDNPTDMRLVDLDGDNDLDVVTADRDAGALSFLKNNGAGVLTRTVAPAPTTPTRLGIADLNDDGNRDLLVTSGGIDSATMYFGDGAGAFVEAGTFSVNDGLLDVELVDLSGDGLPEIIAPASGLRSIIVIEQTSPGVFNDGVGCATGDYFMNFNVADSAASDPEPVFTLQTMFDAWRAQLAGRPDAVLSSAAFDSPAMPRAGRVSMTITLRDWRGEEVSLPPAEVVVEHASDSAGLSEIEEVVDLGGGVYRVELTGPVSGTGQDVFRVAAMDEMRPVVVMPRPSIAVVESPADFDGSGSVDIMDFLEFFDAFGDGRIEADVTGDGVVDELDASFFLASFTL
jgi:hypothetical protein